MCMGSYGLKGDLGRKLREGQTKSKRKELLLGYTQNKKENTKEDLPPKKSPPSSGGPTRLGIGRRSSARKRSGVSGRSRSRSKAFSTKR